MTLVTWNMQGSSASTDNKWNAGVAQLLTNWADICCVQECGGLPQSAKFLQGYQGLTNLGLYSWGGSGRHTRYILFYPADPNGNRCNLAIISKTQPTAAFLKFPPSKPIWRPTIGATIGGTNYFSLHAISGSGVDAPALVNAAFATGNQVIIAGDYNRAPSGMANSGVVCPPNGPTHPATRPSSHLDYAIRNFGTAAKGQVLNIQLSDHLPVQYA